MVLGASSWASTVPLYLFLTHNLKVLLKFQGTESIHGSGCGSFSSFLLGSPKSRSFTGTQQPIAWLPMLSRRPCLRLVSPGGFSVVAPVRAPRTGRRRWPRGTPKRRRWRCCGASACCRRGGICGGRCGRCEIGFGSGGMLC